MKTPTVWLEYRLINPSDNWSFAAPSDEIAFVIALLAGNGMTPAERDGWSSGFYMAGVGDPEKDYKKQFGKNLNGIFKRSSVEIAASLNTFMIDRDKYKGPKLRGEALRKWNNDHRSSLNDYGTWALGLAEKLNKANKKKSNEKASV